ncbi:MAG: aminotransferase class I/II-fold pyridoxal phosphate-dependent enzyme [Proteobacteria bacterium]|nr:aminotransferase class I/II-fold pyridoxal phosphate-dependent enzyme [Pseudomonadota bacterium]
MLRPVTLIEDLKPYSVLRHPAPITYSLENNECLLNQAFDVNSLITKDTIRKYPSKLELEQLIATKYQLSPSQVIVGAGGDDVLERFSKAVLEEGREIILPVPTFEMIERYAYFTKAKIIKVKWEDRYPIEEVVSKINKDTAVITVVSPNNPNGLIIAPEELVRISQAATNSLILLDLAYTEFAEIDLTDLALTLKNVVVFRTFSKAWALAGLRVGYALGPENVISWMKTVANPYSVSGVTLEIAKHILSNGESEVEKRVSLIKQERAELENLFQELGENIIHSEGNFIFVRSARALWIWQALSGLGIAIRQFGNKEYLENCLRIACPGDGVIFKKLIAGIKGAYLPQALLFDLDGTLVSLTAFFASRRNPQISLQEILLVEIELLQQLKSKFKLGIVTSCAKEEAEEVLLNLGLKDIFDVLVTPDEAPSKPDPRSVQYALKQLNVESAWMVGDTTRDIKAARNAEVVPLGILHGAENFSLNESSLLKAGAAKVLKNISELGELIYV